MDPIVIYLVITVVFSVLLLIMAITGGLGGMFGGDIGVHVGGDIGADVGADMGGVGHDIGHDVGHDAGQFSGTAIHPLSLPVLFAFGAFFGAFGVVMESLALLDVVVVPFVAALLAAVVSAIAYFMLRMIFSGAQATTEYKLADLIGARGEVTVPLRPGIRGQVLVATDARGRTLLSAVSSQELSTGDRVQIKGIEGGALVVEKIQE